jgi:hypothetical protein
VARTFIKPVEPVDLPPLKQEAIAIFTDAGWGEDAKWLGPLALSVFKDADGDKVEPILGDCARHNSEVVARSLRDAGGLHDRDRALLIAFARLCGCGDKSADLWHLQPSIEDPPRPPRAPPGLEEWRKIAAEFRANRPHAKGADFEGALVRTGWPGQYEPDAELGSWLTEYARGMIGRGERRSFYELPTVVRLMHVLVDAAGLDLTKVINEGAVVSAGVPRWGPDPRQTMQLRVPNAPDLKPDSFKDAGSLANWVVGLGPRAIRLFFPVFETWKNDEYAGAMALGVRDVLEKWLLRASGHPTYFREGGPLLAEATRPYFDLLHKRCASAPAESAPAARRAWLWFAWCTFEADPNSWNALQSEIREGVLRAANEDISRVRKLLARARTRPLKGEERERMLAALAKCGESLPPLTPADLCQGHGHLLPADADGPAEEKQRTPWEEFEWEKDHLQTSLILLFQFGGVWRGLKPMLLAWRSLATPAVARDLRYWQETDREQPPQPWADLVAWPINLFHVYVGREQSSDPDLLRLRGELASFCLERLADRWTKAERDEAKRVGRSRSNDDMLERSPEWRYCLIRAAGSLGMNPEGKGHRILRVAADLDPEAEVRDAANQSYEQLRRNVGLPEEVSPRRAIMSALWWIRQAHLLGLGIQPDPDGAQRTRVKELARTKETERVDKPATREKQ